MLVGAPRIELGSLAPKASILPMYYAPVVLEWGQKLDVQSRSAENRTRVSRTRSVYTTAVLHSGSGHHSPVYPGAVRENRTPISSLARTRSTTKP